MRSGSLGRSRLRRCILLLNMSTMPVLRYLRYLHMRWTVGLDQPMWVHRLCRRRDRLMLHVTGLDVLGVACNERHVFAFLVLQADFPASEKFWPRLHILEPWVLKWSLELSAHNVLKAVIGDNVVVSALVFHGYGLLHETPFLEFVAVNERPTETPLLVRCKALCEVGVDLAHRVAFARQRSFERSMLVLIIRVVDIVASLRDRRSGTFLTLALCTA